jgi:hypothetical protein
MSFLKPLNSSESNLYHIRLNTPSIKSSNLIDNKIKKACYNDPCIDQLP